LPFVFKVCYWFIYNLVIIIIAIFFHTFLWSELHHRFEKPSIFFKCYSIFVCFSAILLIFILINFFFLSTKKTQFFFEERQHLKTEKRNQYLMFSLNHLVIRVLVNANTR
jgi:hypothetical protein